MSLLKHYKAAPLDSSFFLASIIGMMISVYMLGKGDALLSWGIAFLIVFIAMFISSMISMAKAPIRDQIAVNVKKKKKK